jgi:hypothetical protein
MAIPVTTSIPVIKTQDLVNSDAVLVSSLVQENFFNPETDFINTFVYDQNNNLIQGININYTVLNTKIEDNTVKEIQIDPSQDLQSNLLTSGIYNLQYNFLRNATGVTSTFYIKEISTDRTEIRIDNTSLDSSQKQEVYTKLLSLLNSGDTFKGIYLSPADDNFLLIVNVGFDADTILLKLYQPLPTNYSLKTNITIDEKVSEPQAYQVEWLEEEVPFDDRIFLKGPNFNLNTKNQVNNSTEFTNFNTIYTSSLSTLTSQLGSILAERRAELNTDYTDYNNFVFFSSAEQRLANFYYKASLIENYNNQISVLNTLTTTPQVSSSIAVYQSKINDIIVNFDGYDYFLYFDSGSESWPKSTSTPPYTLYSTGSSQVINWYVAQSLSASLFDGENSNYIYNIFPTFVTEDLDNNQFQLFTEMAAQMFDEIWLYTQAIKNRQDGDNSLEGGISKDLVADALRSYGLTLYQSSFTDSDLFTSLLGIDQAGNTLPPTGSELITNYITSSAETTPFDDAQKLIYKRLYHNLPILLKKKGTVAGLRILLSCFGIPDTLIRISEFGGKDKNFNTWDYWNNQFNYAYKSTGSYYLSSSFALNSTWGVPNNVPGAVEFRFKAESVPPTNYSQSLWYTDKGLGVFLEYNGSGLTTSSYSASIVDPNYQYGTLKFISGTDSASVYLPFFNDGWWSVLVNSSSAGYELYAKNSIYNGEDGNTLGFQASSLLNISTLWSASTQIFFASSSATHKGLSGSLQEIRYYTQPITEESFNAYVMNPSSIEQSQYLAFRASLGGELYTGSTSIHPKITGSWVSTSSFTGTSNFYISSTPTYSYNNEYFLYDQPPVGIKNRVSNKIKQSSLILPSTGSGLPTTNVLSSFIKIQQDFSVSQSYTSDLNLAEIAYSPQNEINDDISSQLGYFNIGDYLDIRGTGSSYPALNTLRNQYFEKYKANYDYKDYIRLIKYFDNALFKMIKDYVPARTSISTGIVIKQHILERNKYSEPVVTFTQPEYTSSIDMYTITGSSGGVFENIEVTQSWSGSYITPNGLVPYIQSTEDEFYNGEFSGSIVTVTDGQLSDCMVNIVEIYSNSSLIANLNPNNPGEYFTSYDLDYEKTYYFSFTITEINGLTAGTLELWNEGTSINTLYTSPTIAAGGTLTVNYLELSKIISPLTFKAIGPSSTGFSITNFTIYEAQLDDMDGDCDPLINNTSTYPLSQYYMKADYNSGQLTPTNFDSIISGSATRAAVKDYYYNLRRQILPRYNGSRLTGYQINAFTSSTDTSYGKSPVIERYSNFFIYFDWIGGANPQYPGGGNVHGVYLIDIEGNSVPLTTNNSNLGRVENIFKKGTTANILPAVYSAGSSSLQVEIVDGGALYNTIVVNSGSNLEPSFAVYYSSSYNFVSNVAAFTTQSNIILTDTGSIYRPWLYPFLTTSSVLSGSVRAYGPGLSFVIYNKITDTYVNDGFISQSDTYFPLQVGDIIRFGDTGSSPSSSVDSSFTALGIYQIANISIGNDLLNSSSITLNSLNITNQLDPNLFTWDGSSSNRKQKYRIMRRIPNETFVLVKNKPSYTDPGFLIPSDFNPNYDVYELARKAGIIT